MKPSVTTSDSTHALAWVLILVLALSMILRFYLDNGKKGPTFNPPTYGSAPPLTQMTLYKLRTF